MRFAAPIGGGLSLALRTLDTVDEMLALTLRNQERLRHWEPWADAEQTRSSMAEFTRWQLAQFAEELAIPTVVVDANDRLVGAASLRPRDDSTVAELGYWIDAAAEGQGIARRACSALLEHAVSLGVVRAEIATSAANLRSVALAERLGFWREPRSSDVAVSSVGEAVDPRLDLAVFVRSLDAADLG